MTPQTLTQEFTELGQFELHPAAAKLLDLEFCLKNLVVVLGPVPLDGSPVQVGTVDAKNESLLAALKARLARPVQLIQLNAFEVRHAIVRMYATGETVFSETELSESAQIGFELDQPASGLVNDTLAAAVRMKATDVHVEVYENDVDLRFRISGVMKQIATPISPENIKSVCNRIKVMAGLDIAEKRRPQDGSIIAYYTDSGGRRQITFRVSLLPTIWGEIIAIRVLDPAHFEMTIEHLGMPEPVLNRYCRLARFPHGMLLVTGPTGSGKTTTLYCTIREILRRDDIKIMTVEDPVEYRLEKVAQTHASPQMNFAEALRAFLRQNADVLLVGEIRDSETAEVAIRAATTGHLILSTVHTRDAVSAVARLRALGVSDDLLASSLIGVVAQRLVRRICPDCKAPHTPDQALVDSFFKSAPATPFYKGAGCAVCGGTGYSGEIGLFELFVPDEAIASLIAAGASIDELHRAASAGGFKTLLSDALEKVSAGITSLEEVARKLPPVNV